MLILLLGAFEAVGMFLLRRIAGRLVLWMLSHAVMFGGGFILRHLICRH